MKLPTIGIVGGVGPLAGATLVQRIYEASGACCDQAQPRVLLASYPSAIADRTSFLLGQTSVNPAQGINRVLRDLHDGGATVAGIACVTAHAQPIYSAIYGRSGQHPKLISLSRELLAVVKSSGYGTIGVLSTLGTYQTGLFQQLFEGEDCRPVFPDADTRERVHEAVYSLKANQFDLRAAGRVTVEEAARGLLAQGAEAVLLGCTELPLLLEQDTLDGSPLLDPLKILAAALLREHESQNKAFLDELHRTCSKLCCHGSPTDPGLSG